MLCYGLFHLFSQLYPFILTFCIFVSVVVLFQPCLDFAVLLLGLTVAVWPSGYPAAALSVEALCKLCLSAASIHIIIIMTDV